MSKPPSFYKLVKIIPGLWENADWHENDASVIFRYTLPQFVNKIMLACAK